MFISVNGRRIMCNQIVTWYPHHVGGDEWTAVRTTTGEDIVLDCEPAEFDRLMNVNVNSQVGGLRR